MRRVRNRSVVCALVVLIALMVVPSFAAEAEEPQTAPERSEELLLEIMDVHTQLVTNNIFLAQAKVIAAYLEASLQLEKPNKVKAYEKVLKILSQIRAAPPQAALKAVESVRETPEEAVAEGRSGQETKPTYEPGAALLEIFKANTIDNLPPLPVTRAYWKRDLACSEEYVLPDRIKDVGRNSPYVAKFSFYYHAKEPGLYGFIVALNSWSLQNQACKLRVSGVDVIDVGPAPNEVTQGVCNLDRGFHRLEFFFASTTRFGRSAFEVKVLPPRAFDAVLLTKDMMLLKIDQKKASQADDAIKAKPKRIPYVDY